MYREEAHRPYYERENGARKQLHRRQFGCCPWTRAGTVGDEAGGAGRTQAVETGQAEHSSCPGVPALLLLFCHTRREQFPVDLT